MNEFHHGGNPHISVSYCPVHCGIISVNYSHASQDRSSLGLNSLRTNRCHR